MKKAADETRIHLHAQPQEAAGFQHEERLRGRRLPAAALLAIALFFLFWCSLLFTVPYHQFSFSPAFIFETVKRRAGQLYLFFFGSGSSIGIMVYQYTAAMLVGAALAACGSSMQAGFRNMLAGPSTMGVMAGGTLGCLAYLLLFTSGETEIVYYEADLSASRSLFDLYGQQLFTLAGCLGGVVLILGIATIAGRGRPSPSAMIVSGTVFSQLLNTAFMVVQYYILLQNPADSRIETLRDLMMGSFDNVASWQTLVMMGVPILICLGIFLALSGRLNLLSIDSESARTMGVNTDRYRYACVLLSSVITAVVVSFCGHIGFLGFMIPLVGRKLVGPNLRRLLPVCMLLGAILLTLVFDAAYILQMTDTMNLFTSSIGSVVMLLVLLRGRRGGNRRASV